MERSVPGMKAQVIVAGHICLDIIPQFHPRSGDSNTRFTPGKLVNVGPAQFSTGGAVANTGLALHRIGIPTRLMGKVGDDIVGHAILDAISRVDPELSSGMIIDPAVPSSYTVVISPPGQDRMFFHCPGANDTFHADDVAYDRLEGARFFHFGYPTLMRSMFSDGGREMETIFQRVKARGLTTSLDMSMPDQDSEVGQVDWTAWLRRVLPHVDVFLPSLDEIQLMIGCNLPLSQLSQLLHDWGAKIVGFKMGDQGLYVRWSDRERVAPCFKVNVAGTTGSGDCTIAGFLAGLAQGLPPDDVMTLAVATGACCCEAPDATSGVRPWREIQDRINAGWPRLPSKAASGKDHR